MRVHERHIEPAELEDFEQCWLIGTAVEVTPVSEIGDWRFEVGGSRLRDGRSLRGEGARLAVMAFRPRPAHVLIDWNSELRALPGGGERDGAEVARRALKLLCRSVGKLLYEKAEGEAFFLFLRAYHGWRRGFDPTPRRRALEAARAFDPNDPEDRGLGEYSPRSSQVLRSLEFGDRLLGARDIRLCGSRQDHHLPSTLQQDRAGVLGEKMVDTALVSDLIHLAAEDDGSWLVVVGQDADLVPGILTADGLLQGTNRRVIFLARGGISNSNPKMTDLICRR